jgi:hypothetical protein
VKKIIAYSFILLANFVLLSHAVIPHHHHEKQVCIESTHCESDSEAHQHEATEQNHNHNHEHDGNGSSCILKQAFVLNISKGKQINGCSDCNNNHSHDFQFILFNVSPETFIPTCKTVILAIEVTPFYSALLQSSLDLRAPPKKC